MTNVKCLAPNCGVDSSLDVPSERRPGKKRRKREDRTLDPSELLQIPIDQEIVQRYVKLKRKKKLESDRTTIYCPRQWCQGPARSKKSSSMSQEEGSDSDADIPEPPVYDQNTSEDLLPPPEERLAICEDCTFAFCKVCKASWHGEFFSCYPRRQNELTAEEKASEEYMKMHTTPCPTCDARCQKTMGCNHMICFKCNSHFCYLCSSWLDQNNPYEHFNTVKKPCYMRLWELEAGDGAEVGINFEGGADIPNPIDDIQRPAPPPPPAPIPPPPPLAPLANPNRPNPEAVARNAPPDPGLQARQARRQARIQLRLRQQAAPARDLGPPMQGLQRFLQMVRNDEEDEWDSDEMGDGDDREEGNDDDSDDDNNNDDDDDDRWIIPVR